MDVARSLGWQAVEHYDLANLRTVLAELSPHAAILASLVPETFSYTLSELRALGIPTIATRLGAFTERIADGEDGLLIEPTSEALVQCIAALQRQPERLGHIAATLAALPRPRGVQAMIADYHALLQLAPRPLARFPLRDQPVTALTDAYAQLDSAYRSLEAAYHETHAAYESTREAYEGRERDLAAVVQERDRLRAEIEAMRVRRWAANMVSTLRSRARRGEPQS